MKAVFLDIDGVLNNQGVRLEWDETGRKPHRAISSNMIHILNLIVKATDSKVIVSSCWRLSLELGTLDSYLKEFGAEFDLLNKTPRRFRGHQDVRGDEIQASMDEYSLKPEDIIILDDDGIGLGGGEHPLDCRLIKVVGGLQVHHIAHTLELMWEEE